MMKPLLENLRYSLQSIKAQIKMEENTIPATWGYGLSNGPDTWGQAWPIAVEGKQQSPISLSWAAVEDKTLNQPRLMVTGGKCYFDIENTGETWKATVKIEEGSETAFLRNGPLQPKHVYALEQFHAHWGSNEYRGSEHMVDGKSYAAELHLVFWNTQYKSFKEAMNQSDGLAVLAVFLEEGETRKNELHQICDTLKDIKYKFLVQNRSILSDFFRGIQQLEVEAICLIGHTKVH